MKKLLIAVVLLLLGISRPGFTAGERPEPFPDVPLYSYKVLKTFPHDPSAFTQGLVIADGVLYEGTGLNGSSSLRRVDLETGVVQQIRKLHNQFFGEGVAVFGSKIIQLTWRSRVGFVYDQNTFELLRIFPYAAEGWGLTTDGRHLIASDGTATLRFLDPETFKEQRRLEVVDRSGPVSRLNELEYVAGRIYANVWQTDRIAIIDATNGRVTGWLDLSGLLSAEERSGSVDVLNGIAYDQRSDRLYVTGKLWPRLFQIQLGPPLSP